MSNETIIRHLAAMGTALSLTVSAPTRDAALRASEAGVREIERIEALLSTWRDDTPLARVNTAPVGTAQPIPAELGEILGRVFAWSERTGGAFDPTVLPLVRVWGLRTGGRIPDATELHAALEATGGSLFTFEESSPGLFFISKRHPLGGIDEGAWGKGWALDKAAAAMREAGAVSGLLDLGGQILAFGEETSVDVADPRERGKTVARLRLADASASTSGNSERSLVVNGRRIGHLLDPRTGLPARDFGSVTVVAPSGLVADVLSTAFFVLGPEEGRALSTRLRAEGVAHETSFFLEGEEGNSDPATRLKELEQKIDVLTKEIEGLRIGETTPSAPSPQPTLGLGPAASKVYSKNGVSIGGYGEILYQNFSGSREDGSASGLTPTIDLARAVLYFGYKFDEHFVFNSEIEYEHAVTASDKEGETEVEFAYLDWLSGKRAFNARAGLVLIPVGLINQLHEPPVFLGARRPDVETVILPSTWREIGFGAWGDAGPFSYRLYLVNGLNAEGFAADGLREGSQEGSNALARNFAFTGRLDYAGLPGVLVGASFFTGNSAQDHVTPAGKSFGARTTFVDLHLDARWRGASFRALWAESTVGDSAAINQLNGFEGDESIGKKQEGWYVEAGFDVLSLTRATRMSLTPFVRYEAWDTQAAVPDGYARNPENDVTQWTAGVVFKPIPQVVVKVDGQWRQNAAKTGVNQLNVALGYEF
jgi:thiamine biosynthesis lipoprotein ApbE